VSEPACERTAGPSGSGCTQESGGSCGPLFGSRSKSPGKRDTKLRTQRRCDDAVGRAGATVQCIPARLRRVPGWRPWHPAFLHHASGSAQGLGLVETPGRRNAFSIGLGNNGGSGRASSGNEITWRREIRGIRTGGKLSRYIEFFFPAVCPLKQRIGLVETVFIYIEDFRGSLKLLLGHDSGFDDLCVGRPEK